MSGKEGDVSQSLVASSDASKNVLRTHPMLVALTFGFILVLLIIIFMQVAKVGYYREKMTVDEAKATLVSAQAKYDAALKVYTDLQAKLAESELKRAEADASADVIRVNDELRSQTGAAQSDLSTSRAEFEKAKRDLDKLVYDDMPKWRQRRHDRTQLIKACRQSVPRETKGLARLGALRKCYKTEKSKLVTAAPVERMCDPTLGPAECSLLSQSGFN